MPKVKTHRSAAKRFRATARGKVKRSHAFLSHICTSKTTKRKRHLRKADYVAGADMGRVRRQLGM